MNIKSWIIDMFDSILFNERCLVCNNPHKILCRNCITNLPKPEHDLPENIISLFEYRNPVIKKILTDAKYRNKFAGLKIFGPYLESALVDITSEHYELNNYSNIILIPVPISKKRFKNRGYNQAEIIVKNILENSSLNKYILGNNIIRKIKDKTPQASIHDRKKRLASPIGTFEINKSEIDLLKNSMCVIVDDITTTGGTILEMRRILIKSGASRVIGLTIAH